MKSNLLVPKDEYFMFFWGAEQILFYENFWFIRQKMEIYHKLRYPIFRARIIYLVKSNFLVPKDGYYMVFWGAEQILFYEKFWFIKQKTEMPQNLRYQIFRAKMANIGRSFALKKFYIFSFLYSWAFHKTHHFWNKQRLRRQFCKFCDFQTPNNKLFSFWSNSKIFLHKLFFSC